MSNEAISFVEARGRPVSEFCCEKRPSATNSRFGWPLLLFIWCVTLFTNSLAKEISRTDQSRSDIHADQIGKYHFVRKIQTPFKDIRKFVWSDDGTLIATVDQRQASVGAPTHIVVINATSGAIVANLTLEGAPYGLELAVKFSKTGKYFAAGHSIIKIWRTTDWKMVNTVQGPFVRGQVSQGVSGLDFSPSYSR